VLFFYLSLSQDCQMAECCLVLHDCFVQTIVVLIRMYRNPGASSTQNRCLQFNFCARKSVNPALSLSDQSTMVDKIKTLCIQDLGNIFFCLAFGTIGEDKRLN
jgi:hypothetical protein